MKLTQAYLKRRLTYSKTTGEFTWKYCEDMPANWNGRFAGKRAGSLDGYGYVQISIDGKMYRGHQLAVLYMAGVWPTRLVDHRDNNTANNRWKNLRPATRAENGRNAKRSKANSTGIKGLTPYKLGGFIAQITVDKKNIYVGVFKTKTEGAKAIAAKRKGLHKEFANNG